MIDIFDINGILNTQRTVDPSNRRGLPSGGITRVLENINYSIKKNHGIVLFCDKGNNPRRTMSSDYKSNRNYKPDINVQLDFLIERLSLLGIPVYYGDDGEADDYIIKYCEKLTKQNPDEFINVYTGDRDLLAVVDSRVSVIGINKNLKNVDAGNFVADVSDMFDMDVYMGTIPILKFFIGDKSDNITNKIPNGKELYRIYVDKLLEMKVPMGVVKNPNILKSFLKSGNVWKDEYETRLKIFFPLDVDLSKVSVTYEKDINMKEFGSLLYAMGDKYLGIQHNSDLSIQGTPDLDKIIYNWGRDFNNGDYAIKNSKPLETPISYADFDSDFNGLKEL